MKKHLLLLLILSFFQIACAEETQMNTKAIETLLLEDTIENYTSISLFPNALITNLDSLELYFEYGTETTNFSDINIAENEFIMEYVNNKLSILENKSDSTLKENIQKEKLLLTDNDTSYIQEVKVKKALNFKTLEVADNSNKGSAQDENIDLNISNLKSNNSSTNNINNEIESQGVNSENYPTKVATGNYKNESKEDNTIRFRTGNLKRKIAPLLTDPKAHNKNEKLSYIRVEGSPTKKTNLTLENKNQQANLNSIKDNSVSQQSSKTPTRNNNFSTKKISLNKVNPRQSNIQDSSNNGLSLRLLRKQNIYETNKNYTLLFEVTNNTESISFIDLTVGFPDNWRIISTSNFTSLQPKEKQIGTVSFYIPNESPAGKFKAFLTLNSSTSFSKKLDFDLEVANNYDIEVFKISAPQQVQAGELITSSFGIKNNGNIDQEITLSSNSSIKNSDKIIIPKDSTVVIEVTKKTNSNSTILRRVSTSLEVMHSASKRKYYNTQTIQVIPSKIKQKDPYFRYPIQASLYYNSRTLKNYHYSTISAELRGNGFLDIDKNHHLNFIIRAPKKENIKRFSIVDQYSLIYRFKDQTTLYLGDHSYFINRLGFGSRYGIGFKLDHTINKWTYSAFYSSPRLYNFSRKPLYGVRAEYASSDSLRLGLTFEKSNGNNFIYRNIFAGSGKGQILTFDYNYFDKNTRFEAELSGGFNNTVTDFATDLSFSQSYKHFAFSSTLIYAGRNYIGNISNSLQVSNNLYYNYKGLNLGIGHSVSRVNRRLDPLYFETEPYYEAYFATIGYRFSNKHFFNVRFDKRIREDQLEPVSYNYEEYGLSYNFNYFNKYFTGSFGGRFAKTQNILAVSETYRDTYSHHLNVSYKLLNNLQLRGGINYLFTNRYGVSDKSINYLRYSFGFNYNLMRRLTLNVNYNSGYSPEENYKRREYINLNLRANINKHHRLEIRANYFENPAVINNKELFAYAKYTYSFGLGIKKLFDQGGVDGTVFSNSEDIDIKGIKLYTAGQTITTDKYGNFELNNLELGINYIYVEEASLPLDVVSAIKNPIEVNVEKDSKAIIKIELMKARSLNGNLVLVNKANAISTNLESFVKLENSDFTYYTEVNKDGTFKFKNIVPGNYKFKFIRFKKNEKAFQIAKEIDITVSAEKDTQLEINVKAKEKRIKFKNNNLKVGYND